MLVPIGSCHRHSVIRTASQKSLIVQDDNEAFSCYYLQVKKTIQGRRRLEGDSV